MGQVKFVIEAGNIDSMGNMIKIDGLKIPGKDVLLTRDFDVYNPIGKCNVFKEDGVLKADAELPDEMLNSYPAIAFNIIKSENGENGIRIINEAKLLSVSLCSQPNTDPSIKRVSEQ